MDESSDVATYDNEIDETVRTVWEAMLGLPLQRQEATACDGEPVMAGIVVIDGDFSGALKVGCGPELAQRIAQIMFDDDGPPTAADISDALGEVSNMIAGNLKTSLPGKNRIGLPVVAYGTDYELAIPRANQIGMVSYVSGGQCLQVALMQHGELT